MEDRVILTPKERLQRLSEHFDVSVRGLAKLSEMSEATLYHITDQTRDMSGRTAARLCYQLERKRGVVVDRNWLLTGNGRMLVDISVAGDVVLRTFLCAVLRLAAVAMLALVLTLVALTLLLSLLTLLTTLTALTSCILRSALCLISSITCLLGFVASSLIVSATSSTTCILGCFLSSIGSTLCLVSSLLSCICFCLV